MGTGAARRRLGGTLAAHPLVLRSVVVVVVLVAVTETNVGTLVLSEAALAVSAGTNAAPAHRGFMVRAAADTTTTATTHRRYRATARTHARARRHQPGGKRA